jgi:hypothetical protein
MLLLDTSWSDGSMMVWEGKCSKYKRNLTPPHGGSKAPRQLREKPYPHDNSGVAGGT